jgi:cyclopropane fatty-acyl-phospholipid synthase-like methyltransferase
MFKSDTQNTIALNHQYTSSFFNNISGESFCSAQAIVPLAIELIEPKSVVDVGCGTGAWLSVFKQHGIEEILGLDGDYVNRDQLMISSDQFQAQDLQKSIDLQKSFDLVVSLEVAEHLPPDKAAQFVESLTKLGRVVLFSAAIPYQPGTNHINCQWPDYWSDLFFERGYIPLDCFRQTFWNHPSVAWWYAQNMILFVSEEHLEHYSKLIDLLPPELSYPLRLVHPELFMMQQLACEAIVKSVRSTQ